MIDSDFASLWTLQKSRYRVRLPIPLFVNNVNRLGLMRALFTPRDHGRAPILRVCRRLDRHVHGLAAENLPNEKTTPITFCTMADLLKANRILSFCNIH